MESEDPNIWAPHNDHTHYQYRAAEFDRVNDGISPKIHDACERQLYTYKTHGQKRIRGIPFIL